MNEQVDMSLVVGILITMVFSAFFSGMEIAFVSSNRMLAEMDKEKNGLTQRLLSLFYNHPNGFVSTMLVGNNIALVVYGILIARLFDNTIFAGFDAAFTVPADTILSTLIVLFTGEFLPKTLPGRSTRRVQPCQKPSASAFPCRNNCWNSLTGCAQSAAMTGGSSWSRWP